MIVRVLPVATLLATFLALCCAQVDASAIRAGKGGGCLSESDARNVGFGILKKCVGYMDNSLGSDIVKRIEECLKGEVKSAVQGLAGQSCLTAKDVAGALAPRFGRCGTFSSDHAESSHSFSTSVSRALADHAAEDAPSVKSVHGIAGKSFVLPAAAVRQGCGGRCGYCCGFDGAFSASAESCTCNCCGCCGWR